MKAELEFNGALRIRLIVCLLTSLQMACSYTPVYDSTGRPQAGSTYPNEQTSPPNQDKNTTDDALETAEQPVRVAVASPDLVKHKPTVSNKDIAAAKLRSQAADAVVEGQTAKAERLLNRALRISPRSPETYHQLASIKLDQGANSQALQLARKGLSLSEPGSTLADQLHALASQALAD